MADLSSGQRQLLKQLKPEFNEYVVRPSFFVGFLASLFGAGFGLVCWGGLSLVGYSELWPVVACALIFGAAVGSKTFARRANTYDDLLWELQAGIREVSDVPQPPRPGQQQAQHTRPSNNGRTTQVLLDNWDVEMPQPHAGALAKFIRESLNGRAPFSQNEAERRGWTRDEYKRIQQFFLRPDVGMLDGKRKLNGVPMWTDKAHTQLRRWVSTASPTPTGQQVV